MRLKWGESLTVLGVCALGVWLAGCSSSGGDEITDPGPPDPAPAGMLQLASGAELEAAIERAFTRTRSSLVNSDVFTFGPAAPDAAALTASASAAGTFTGTYTQEANVDELDAVRYDGEHLYVAPQRYMTCCFIQPAAGT